MTIPLRQERLDDHTLALEVSGDVESTNASELRTALGQVADGEAVVVDLRNVPFMDSAGLGALICGIREVHERGGAAALCVKPGGVRRLLSITGFDQVVPTQGTLDEACDAAKEVRQLAMAGSPTD